MKPNKTPVTKVLRIFRKKHFTKHLRYCFIEWNSALKKYKQLFEYQHLLLLRDIWGLYHKTYYGRNLQFPQQARVFVPKHQAWLERLARDKHSSLLREP